MAVKYKPTMGCGTIRRRRKKRKKTKKEGKKKKKKKNVSHTGHQAA